MTQLTTHARNTLVRPTSSPHARWTHRIARWQGGATPNALRLDFSTQLVTTFQLTLIHRFERVE